MGWDTVTGTYNQDNLILAGFPVKPRAITLSAGDLARGCVLGRKTADDEYIACVHDAVDGSQVPRCVLAEDTDATGGDTETLAYWTGIFDENKLTFGGSSTIADLRELMWDNNLFTEDASD